MRFSIKTKKGLDEWHDCFIWLPEVIVDSETQRKFLVWLETVRRKRQHFKGNYWKYRIKWPTHGEWNI
jgi:hypothetical protein